MRDFRQVAFSDGGCGKHDFSTAVKSASSSLACCQLLSIWSRRGNSSLGLYTKLAAKAVRPNSLPLSSKSSPDVLPVPIASVVVLLPSLVKDHFAELMPVEVFTSSFPVLSDLVTGAVVALNCMYSAGWSDNPIEAKASLSLSNMQVLVVCNVIRGCIRFMSSSTPFSWGLTFKELAEKRVSYAGAAVSVRRDLKAPLVVAV